jgi:plasmid stability protein
MLALWLHYLKMPAMSDAELRTLTVRNVPADVVRALKARALGEGRSTEAEIRVILEAAVRPAVGMGTALAALGKKFGGVDLDLDALPRRPYKPKRLDK